VYGISTIGNVAGTLLTTLILVPSIGSRNITYIFAVTLAACARCYSWRLPGVRVRSERCCKTSESGLS
jgi:hypothetical protein